MLGFLIAIGRFFVSFAAVLFVIGGAIGGYNAPNQPAPMPYGFAPFEPVRAITAVLGLLGGFILAGISLGPVAALFDIQRRVAAAVPTLIARRDPADWRR